MRQGSAHLLDCLRRVELRTEEVAVSLLDGLDALRREAAALEADLVAAVAASFARPNDHRKRWHVLRDDGARTEVSMPSDADELVQQTKGADRGVVLDDDVPGKLRSVDQDDAIADDAVVADVRVGHDQAVAADAGHASTLDRAAMHRAEFAKLVCIAHFELDALAGVGQVLRVAADDRKGMEVVVAAERRWTFHDRVRFEDAAIAQLDLVADDGAGPDPHALSQLRGGRNDGP